MTGWPGKVQMLVGQYDSCNVDFFMGQLCQLSLQKPLACY